MLTEKQDRLYWREWGAAVRACKSRGQAVPLRQDCHARALGREKSHLDFTNPDLDKVLGVFRAIIKPSDLNGQLRQEKQACARLLYKITVEQVALLALFTDHRVDDKQMAAENYILSIFKDRRDLSGGFKLPSFMSLTQLDSSRLTLLRNTLAARIDSLRRERGWTVAEMETAAGLRRSESETTPAAEPF